MLPHLLGNLTCIELSYNPMLPSPSQLMHPDSIHDKTPRRILKIKSFFRHQILRVYTFQTPPRQMRGLLRNAVRIALEAILNAPGTDTELDGWKLFVLAPRMLLFRAPGASRVPRDELARRERLFCEGRWAQLLHECVAAARESAVVTTAPARSRPADGSDDDVRRRAERAAALAHMGELSAAAQALTASPLAPATAETLAELRDPRTDALPPFRSPSNRLWTRVPRPSSNFADGGCWTTSAEPDGVQRLGRRAVQMSICGSCWTRSSAPSFSAA